VSEQLQRVARELRRRFHVGKPVDPHPLELLLRGPVLSKDHLEVGLDLDTRALQQLVQAMIMVIAGRDLSRASPPVNREETGDRPTPAHFVPAWRVQLRSKDRAWPPA
jgi:hypothetical protein